MPISREKLYEIEYYEDVFGGSTMTLINGDVIHGHSLGLIDIEDENDFEDKVQTGVLYQADEIDHPLRLTPEMIKTVKRYSVERGPEN